MKWKSMLTDQPENGHEVLMQFKSFEYERKVYTSLNKEWFIRNVQCWLDESSPHEGVREDEGDEKEIDLFGDMAEYKRGYQDGVNSVSTPKQEDGELYEAGQIDALVKDFNKAVNALALEIPQLVWVVFKSKWMKLNSIIQPKQNKSGVDMILSEPETLNRIDKMCAESLPPDYFEKWEQVKNLLIKTRQKLKYAKDSYGLND